MKKAESKGFFCVAYLTNEKKTIWYNKVWKPSKMADYLNREKKPWLWIKIYINKNDYFSAPKANNYHAIFDKDNPVQEFTFQPFSRS